jgi:hypothetical protein
MTGDKGLNDKAAQKELKKKHDRRREEWARKEYDVIMKELKAYVKMGKPFSVRQVLDAVTAKYEHACPSRVEDRIMSRFRRGWAPVCHGARLDWLCKNAVYPLPRENNEGIMLCTETIFFLDDGRYDGLNQFEKSVQMLHDIGVTDAKHLPWYTPHSAVKQVGA